MGDLSGRLGDLAREFRNLEAQMADPEVVGDRRRYVEVTRRYRELEPIVAAAAELDATRGDVEAARELIEGADGAEREALQADIAAGEARLVELDDEVKVLLLPRDPNDDRNVILELRGAEGGEEANLWARDLLEMYRGFASRLGWSFEVLSSSPSELGGISEATLRLAGDGVWTRMKFEAGPHRVQRVPVTESPGEDPHLVGHRGRAARGRGGGRGDRPQRPPGGRVPLLGPRRAVGQHHRLRRAHHPQAFGAGGVDAGPEEPAPEQGQGPAGAALPAAQGRTGAPASSEAGAAKKAQIGGGGRGEKIRTYNFKENRVTDHRIGLTTYNLDRVLAGELDEVSDALVTDERARLLAEATG